MSAVIDIGGELQTSATNAEHTSALPVEMILAEPIAMNTSVAVSGLDVKNGDSTLFCVCSIDEKRLSARILIPSRRRRQRPRGGDST